MANKNIIRLIDSYTGENVNYEEVTAWHDGTAMDDSKVDNVIYRKAGGKYYKRIFEEAVNVRWFGAGFGAADDRPTIQKALDTGFDVFFPNGDYKISDQIEIRRPKQRLIGSGNTRLLVADNSKNHILVSSFTNSITGFRFNFQNIVEKTAYKACVHATVGSGNGTVANCVMEKFGFAGVFLLNSSYWTIRDNEFQSAAHNTLQNSVCVGIWEGSSFNKVYNNKCLAQEADIGISIFDNYAAEIYPQGNEIYSNIIKGQVGYGIIAYVTKACNTRSIIRSNYISDIQGVSLDGLSGQGIYMQSAGGSIISGNIVENCCLNTTQFDTQGVGHITLCTGDYADGQHGAIICSENKIYASKGPGISAVTSKAALNIMGNEIIISSIGADSNSAIKIVNCQDVTVQANKIRSTAASAAISVHATQHPVSNLAVVSRNVHITDNVLEVVAGVNVSALFADAGFIGVKVSKNSILSKTGTNISVSDASRVEISFNNIKSGSVALQLIKCIDSIVFANHLDVQHDGSPKIIIHVDTTGFLKDNIGFALIENNSNKFIATALHTSTDIFHLPKLADRVINTVPVAGQPKGWVYGGTEWAPEGVY